MIQPIVEGQGEEKAFPVLLRRLLPELGCYVGVSGSPFRSKRTQIVREADFKTAVQIAALKPGASAILVLFDADDDCASIHVPNMLEWAREVAPEMPCGVVMARREYEAWFLAAIESLRGQHGISQDAVYQSNPEQVRDAKGAVGSFMPHNASYAPTADQPSLSARFDLGAAYRRASSFRKLVKELCRIMEGLGQEPIIPPDWSKETL
jgi:hypothetical protein